MVLHQRTDVEPVRDYYWAQHSNPIALIISQAKVFIEEVDQFYSFGHRSCNLLHLNLDKSDVLSFGNNNDKPKSLHDIGCIVVGRAVGIRDEIRYRYKSINSFLRFSYHSSNCVRRVYFSMPYLGHV